MTKEGSWEEFFDHHAPEYMENIFTKGTDQEVGFLLDELKLEKGAAILDMGCGTGRHSVQLAKHGLNVTGVDLSTGMLAQARKAADEVGVEVELIKADATKFTTDRQFEAAVCLCEGSFGLLGEGDDPHEHDLSVLRNVFAALKPGGKFILTALSALRKIRLTSKEAIEKGTFDPLTLVEIENLEYETAEGKKVYASRERGYVPSELTLMMKLAGFEVEQVWGCEVGNFKRCKIDPDGWEIMVIARKP